jgi:hypothetical protein
MHPSQEKMTVVAKATMLEAAQEQARVDEEVNNYLPYEV